MAYSLQTHSKLLDVQAHPAVGATDEVFVYPQPSSLNYDGGRPNTMIYGTAPYMAGNGAPGHLVMVDDELRPQSTSQFKKVYVDTVQKNTFPWQKMDCSMPLRTVGFDPASTRVQVQNALFRKRYNNGN